MSEESSLCNAFSEFYIKNMLWPSFVNYFMIVIDKWSIAVRNANTLVN